MNSAKVVPLERHKRFKGHFPKVPLPDSLLAAWEVGLVPEPGKPYAFEFRRRRLGCEVFLRFYGGLNLNLTPKDEQLLPNRAAGRAWAIEFAKQHGFKPMEYRKPRNAACADERSVTAGETA